MAGLEFSGEDFAYVQSLAVGRQIDMGLVKCLLMWRPLHLLDSDAPPY